MNVRIQGTSEIIYSPVALSAISPQIMSCLFECFWDGRSDTHVGLLHPGTSYVMRKCFFICANPLWLCLHMHMAYSPFLPRYHTHYLHTDLPPNTYSDLPLSQLSNGEGGILHWFEPFVGHCCLCTFFFLLPLNCLSGCVLHEDRIQALCTPLYSQHLAQSPAHDRHTLHISWIKTKWSLETL